MSVVMAAPSALVLRCEECGDVPHRVLRGKVGGKADLVFEGVVKWTKCGRVRAVVTREPRPIEVPVVVSWLGASERTTMEFAPDEVVAVGGGRELGEGGLLVTPGQAGRPGTREVLREQGEPDGRPRRRRDARRGVRGRGDRGPREGPGPRPPHPDDAPNPPGGPGRRGRDRAVVRGRRGRAG